MKVMAGFLTWLGITALMCGIGYIYLCVQETKEQNRKSATTYYDPNKAFHDSCKVMTGEITKQELNRRTKAGWYNSPINKDDK